MAGEKTDADKQMTDQHPITPPPELWKQFAAGAYTWKEAVTYAYRAGADHELEACCEWTRRDSSEEDAVALRAARRPKPQRLKEQALEAPYQIDSERPTGSFGETIRRALEQLND